jgi:hypothetical protein
MGERLLLALALGRFDCDEPPAPRPLDRDAARPRRVDAENGARMKTARVHNTRLLGWELASVVVPLIEYDAS